MVEVLQFEFFQSALLAAVLSSVLCGIIGVLVVVNRIVFISAGTAHAAYGGIGLAFFMGWPVLVTTLGFSLGTTILISWVIQRQKHRADSLIGVLWAAGMSLGIILIDLTPGYHPDLMSYLFGSILAIPQEELYYLLGADIFVLATVVLFYHEFISISYDEEFAKVRGLAVGWFYLLLLVMIALSVVFLMRVVGLIMLIALLTIPPLIAEPLSGSVARMMLFSTFFSLIFAVVGLWISYFFNLSSGASIIIVAVVGYILAAMLRTFIRKRSTKSFA
jgi:zinc transport system permease protein